MADDPALSAKDTVVELRGSQDILYRADVVDDGTPSGGWPDRIVMTWDGRLVHWFNEKGEFRCVSAEANTVGWALYMKEFLTDPDHHTTNVWQIVSDRDLRIVRFGVDSAGQLVGTAMDAVTGGTSYGPWTTIPLDPAFAAASGGGYNAPEIRTAPGGWMEMRGRLTSVGAWVANTSVIATLGATWRPTAPAQLLIRASSTMANLIVNTDGTIVSAQAVAGGSNASVEGLRFSK